MSPNITDDDIAAVVAVLRSGSLVQGRKVDEFERAVAEYLGVANVVAVSSGTASLHLALVALGIKAGDEVIVPALSHVATANVVEVVGAKCVFVDVDKGTFNIDVSRLEEAITPRTRAIIPVHEFGLACDISQVLEIARRHNIFVVEDAACALGSTDAAKFAGTFGEIGSFSLHPRKAITSGEGGLLTTDDDAVALRLRVLRNHGIDDANGIQDFVAAGFNYRLTDFQAALAHSQFRRLEDNLHCKRKLADVYLTELSGEENLSLPVVSNGKLHSWQTFHVVLGDGVDRQLLMDTLKATGIGTNYGAQCIPAVTYYREKYGLDCARLFPNALQAYEHGLALPIYEKLTVEDIRFVCGVLKAQLNK